MEVKANIFLPMRLCLNPYMDIQNNNNNKLVKCVCSAHKFVSLSRCRSGVAYQRRLKHSFHFATDVCTYVSMFFVWHCGVERFTLKKTKKKTKKHRKHKLQSQILRLKIGECSIMSRHSAFICSVFQRARSTSWLMLRPSL